MNAILKRHNAPREHAEMINVDKFDKLLLFPAMQCCTDSLVMKLEKVNDVGLKFKDSTDTLRQARAHFGFILEVKPTVFLRLYANARIIHSSIPESGVVEIKEGREGDLGITEEVALRELRVERVCEDEEEASSESIFQRALERFKNRLTICMFTLHGQKIFAFDV